MFPTIWKDFAVATKPTTLTTANEAASVTGVPLRQVHRIIDAGLLGAALKRRNKAQAYPARGRPRTKPRRLRIPKASETLAFDDLGRA